MSHPPERRRIARVLVVEDDDAQRQTLVDLMDSEAYQAIGCATAAEALEVTKTHSFGVAVVDLRLPDLSGTQLLERLREADCRTHVIIHTGYGSFDSAKDAINLGAFAYVEKLGDPAELVRQVHRALADQLSHYAADLEAAVAERTASLQASEQRFHQLFEEAPIAYQSLDETGHFLEVNQAWLTLLGYERREVLGRWFGDFLAPESQEQFRHRFPAFKRAGEVHGVEFTVVRKDGKHRIATFNGTIGRNEHGGFRQTHCVLQDITEHRRAEAARREQEDLLRSVIEGTDDAVFVKDTQGRYLLLNSADARGLGKPAEEIIGLRDRDLFPPEIADAVVKIDRQVIATGERRVYEQTFSLSDTDPRTYVVSKYPRRSAEGNITGVIGIARDITERIQREERLRVLERAVRQSTDGIAVADLEGSIQFINSAWAQMHGHGMTELIGQHLSAFHTPEQMIEDADPFNEQVMSNGAHQGEVGHVRADGSTFPAWMTATLLRDEQGAATGLIAIARDITERKQAEEALRESEERYRAVVDNIELGISLISTDYRILTTNAHTESDFDRSTCELIGEHCFAVFEKRDAPCPHCPGTIAMREHRPAECETEGVRDDGTRFPVRLQMFPMLDADKQIVGFVEVSEDITERKQAEAARAESEQRYRELFSHMTSGVAVYEVHDGGTRFTLTDMNASALRLCQVTRANVLERDITDVFPGMADFGLLDTLRDVWRTGEPKYHPCTQYRDERLQAWYENNVYRLPSGHVVAVFDDVTERMQAEEARRLERNRMMSILDAIPDGVYIVSQQWDIEYVNPVIEREFGPVDGRKCYEYFH
ncbi:MAG: PAS domain S-box protein, partial [bacterium]|nr:PAS domain S-box protein [bacterium]